MLRKAKLSFADKKFLALKSVETAPINIDLSKIVVNKPWGHEYLLTNTPLVEVWHLSLDHLKSTSTHCHPNKKTALIVLDGKAAFSTLGKTSILSARDAVTIEAGVFHSTKCLSKKGLKLLEVETPPMKHDLIRLKDRYGRADTGYESGENNEDLDNINQPGLAIILNGFIKSSNKETVYQVGDVIQTKGLRNSKLSFKNVSLLSISK